MKRIAGVCVVTVCLLVIFVNYIDRGDDNDEYNDTASGETLV